MEIHEWLQQVRSMAERLGVKAVYGEPVVSGETTVIPVASVAFGFGGGFGQAPEAQRGQGGGGGLGFRGWPAGYIEITPAGTRYVSVRSYRNIAAGLLAGFLAGVLCGKIRRRGES